MWQETWCLQIRLVSVQYGNLNRTQIFYAESAETDGAVAELNKDVGQVLGLPEGEKIGWVDLYDALTALHFHGKGWPKGMTEELYRKIESCAVR